MERTPKQVYITDPRTPGEEKWFPHENDESYFRPTTQDLEQTNIVLEDIGFSHEEIAAIGIAVMHECRILLQEEAIPTTLTHDVPLFLLTGEIADQVIGDFDAIIKIGFPAIYIRIDILAQLINEAKKTHEIPADIEHTLILSLVKSNIAHEYFHLSAYASYKYNPVLKVVEDDPLITSARIGLYEKYGYNEAYTRLDEAVNSLLEDLYNQRYNPIVNKYFIRSYSKEQNIITRLLQYLSLERETSEREILQQFFLGQSTIRGYRGLIRMLSGPQIYECVVDQEKTRSAVRYKRQYFYSIINGLMEFEYELESDTNYHLTNAFIQFSFQNQSLSKDEHEVIKGNIANMLLRPVAFQHLQNMLE